MEFHVWFAAMPWLFQTRPRDVMCEGVLLNHQRVFCKGIEFFLRKQQTVNLVGIGILVGLYCRRLLTCRGGDFEREQDQR